MLGVGGLDWLSMSRFEWAKNWISEESSLTREKGLEKRWNLVLCEDSEDRSQKSVSMPGVEVHRADENVSEGLKWT